MGPHPGQYTNVLPHPEPPPIDLGEEPLVTLADIRDAAECLHGIVLRTPLLPFGRPLEGDPLGRPRTWLKPESLQPIGAFKLRGAYYALSQLTPEERERGVVTASSGNHGQGIARAARLLGIRAVVVMPNTAERIKVERIRADGAEVEFVGPASDERAAKANEIAKRDGLIMIPSYDHRDIICGQGTVGLEIAEQMTDLQDPPSHAAGAQVLAAGPFTVLVPVGGGGLSSGVACGVKGLRPDATVIGVEPALAADGRDSLAQGRIVRWPAEQVGRTMADGMRATALGELTFRHLRRWLDGIVVVEESEIGRAMLRASEEARLVLEPSGATALAAMLFHEAELPPGPVVAVLSGGNVDPERYDALLAEAREADGSADSAARREAPVSSAGDGSP